MATNVTKLKVSGASAFQAGKNSSARVTLAGRPLEIGVEFWSEGDAKTDQGGTVQGAVAAFSGAESSQEVVVNDTGCNLAAEEPAVKADGGTSWIVEAGTQNLTYA